MLFTIVALAGYVYIYTLKTNIVIYPKNHNSLEVKLYKFETTLNIEDFDLVSVKSQGYYIYNYVGNLNDMKNVSITFSCHKDSFQKMEH